MTREEKCEVIRQFMLGFYDDEYTEKIMHEVRQVSDEKLNKIFQAVQKCNEFHELHKKELEEFDEWAKTLKIRQ